MTSELPLQDNGLIEALHVQRPAAEHADKLMVFGWVLGGRAVQDI